MDEGPEEEAAAPPPLPPLTEEEVGDELQQQPCRCCLRRLPRMRDLFDDEQREAAENGGGGAEDLGVLYATGTQLEILRNDGLPHQICLECINKLSAAVDFKKMCEQSLKKLKNYLLQHKRYLNEPQISSNSLKLERVMSNVTTPVNSIAQAMIKIEADGDALTNKNGASRFNKRDNSSQTMAEDCLENIYNCSQCSKKFHSLISLSRHMKVRHKLENAVPWEEKHGKMAIYNENVTPHKTNKLYNCKSCRRGFNKLQNFEKHKRRCKIKLIISKRKADIVAENDTIENLLATENMAGDLAICHLKIKQEPIEELLKDGSDQLLGDFPTIDVFGDEMKSDSSESVENIKPKGRGKHRKNKSRFKDAKSYYPCSDCDESFPSKVEFRKHKENHALKLQTFKCGTCRRSFSRREHLLRHEWTHTDERPYHCDVCQKGFIKKELLERHQMRYHSIEKKESEKVAFCEICSKGFTTKKYLETHMRLHSGDPHYSCETCKKTFNTKWHLKEHVKWHSAERPFLCSICGQRFIRNDYLQTHMRRHKGEKPFKCRYCNKGFPRTTDLTVHERYHTGEKAHLCTVCGKGFHRRYNLTVHQRVHTGEKPYACTYCNRTFAQGNDLKSHVRRHTGERFHCELCNEGFIQLYHLTQHKKSVHGVNCESHIRRIKKHVQPNSAGSRNLDVKKENSAPLVEASIKTETSNKVDPEN